MKKLMIVLFAALLLVAFSVPAMAQLSGSPTQWGFYGSARMFTGYVDKDAATPSGLLGAPGNARAVGAVGGFDDSDVVWQIQDNSRFGVNVSAGNITGQVEMGMDAPGDSFESTRIRILKGAWNFGSGVLMLGQDYTPLFFPVSDQCGIIGGDCGLIFWGALYVGRVPQIRLTMGGFQFAALSPSRAGSGGAPAHAYTPAPGSALVSAGGDVAEFDTNFPELEASYTFNLGPAALFIGGGYHTHTQVNTTDNEEDVDAWVVAAGVKSAFGPFYINALLSYSQNPGDYGITQDILPALQRATFVGGVLNDADSFQGVLVVGFKITDMMKIEGGIGYTSNELDVDAGVTAEEATMAYYLQLAYSPVKNVFIVPEIGFIDYGDLEISGEPDEDLGSAWYLGIKWQINF